MRTLNRFILWLELRDVPVWATLAGRWRHTIPAIAVVANVARRVGLRRQAWGLAALAWDVWDNVPLDDSTPAWHATMRVLPWTGGCDTAWQIAAGVAEATAGANPAIYHQFD